MKGPRSCAVVVLFLCCCCAILYVRVVNRKRTWPRSFFRVFTEMSVGFGRFFFVFFCRNNANPKPNTSRSVSRSLSRPVSRENQLKDSISKDSACTCWYHVATRLVNRKLTENNNCLVGFSVFNRKFRSVSFFFFSLLWVVKQSRPKKTRRRFFGFIFWGYRKTY